MPPRGRSSQHHPQGAQAGRSPHFHPPTPNSFDSRPSRELEQGSHWLASGPAHVACT